MTIDTIKSKIEERSDKNIRICRELAEVVVWFCDGGITVSNDTAMKTKDVESSCPEASYHRLERLVNLGFLNKVSTDNPDTWVIHTRFDEIVNGQDLSSLLHEEISRLSDHIKANRTVRNVVANALSVGGKRVTSELYDGGFPEKRKKLGIAVDAVRNDPRVAQGDYGKIIFRTDPNYYCATSFSERLYAK